MKKTVLRDLRIRAGIRACDASEYVGISPKTLHKWEHGGVPRHCRQLVELLDYYNVSDGEKKEVICYLYGGNDIRDEHHTGLPLEVMLDLEKRINSIISNCNEIKALIGVERGGEKGGE